MKNYHVVGPNGGKLKVTLSKDHNGRYTATVHGRSKTLPGAVGDTPKQALARTQELISGTPKRVKWANEDQMKTTNDFLNARRLHEGKLLHMKPASGDAKYDMALLTRGGGLQPMKYIPGDSNYAYTKVKHKRFTRLAHPKSVSSKEALQQFRKWRISFEGAKDAPTIGSLIKMLGQEIKKTESDPKERTRQLRTLAKVKKHFSGTLDDKGNWSLRELLDVLWPNFSGEAMKTVGVFINKAMDKTKAQA
jgi:hypothetical protein